MRSKGVLRYFSALIPVKLKRFFSRNRRLMKSLLFPYSALAFLVFLLIFLTFNSKNPKASSQKMKNKYTPDWDSLDSRPLPDWFDRAKFGIFMHWGVYSVPAFYSEWFWNRWKHGNMAGNNKDDVVEFMKKNFKPGFTYAEFAPMFTAEFFDAKNFAETIKASGAKYFVFTSKHHEGYTMWPSQYSYNWNSMAVGPHRDIVKELRDAILQAGGIRFGLYFSQYEWFNPLYLKDKTGSFATQEYVQSRSIPQMHEIIDLYKPDILWSDGDWEAPASYWNSTDFLAWLYNESPVKDTVVTNDRWGKGTRCQHGGFYSGPDRYEPGHLLPHKWENCMTVDVFSWGFRRTMALDDVLSIESIIEKLAMTISCGGNMLLNIGPTHDGRIVPIFQERLHEIGQWLKVNGEAVYDTKPWIHQQDPSTKNIWYTSSMRSPSDQNPGRLYNEQVHDNTIVYAFLLHWPEEEKLFLGAISATPETKVTMLGYSGSIDFTPEENGLTIDLKSILWRKLPNLWAWVFKLEYLENSDKLPEFGKLNHRY